MQEIPWTLWQPIFNCIYKDEHFETMIFNKIKSNRSDTRKHLWRKSREQTKGKIEFYKRK